MNYKIVVSVFLLAMVGSYFLFSNIFMDKSPEQLRLDGNFESVLDEVENYYGGAMIVKYDEKTGEIISKRPANNNAGRMSVTQLEYEKLKNELPSDVIVINSDVSPSRAIDFIGGDN